MENWRYSVILIICFALAGGIWTRLVYAGSNLDGSLVEIRSPGKDSGINVTGTFEEPVGGLKGFEVSLPNCAQPMAVLPISTKIYSGGTADEYHYHRGSYNIYYVFNGKIYPEDLITYRLSVLRILYRFESMFGLIKGRQFAYYLKIWIPSSCSSTPAPDVSALERAMIVDVF